MTDSIAAERLKSIVERVERLEEEKKGIADDIKDLLAEAKGAGFHVPTIRTLLRLRKMDKDDVDEQEALLETYMRALGMRPGAAE